MAAAYSGHADAVELLLRHHADTTLESEDGKTALDLAKNSTIKNMLMEPGLCHLC